MLRIPLLTAALLAPPPVAAVDSTGRPVPACGAVAESVAPGSSPVAGDLAAALVAHGGAVRWDAGGRALRVWAQDRPLDQASARYTLAEWRGAIAEAVRGWSDVVPGLRLTIARDSAEADVRVSWATTLPTALNDPAAGALASLTAGRTTLAFDARGRAVAASVVLAATAPNGAPYLPRDVRAVARHELGHVLGLAHHASPASVMAPLVVSDRIGDDDRATLRALYRLEVGARCVR